MSRWNDREKKKIKLLYVPIMPFTYDLIEPLLIGVLHRIDDVFLRSLHCNGAFARDHCSQFNALCHQLVLCLECLFEWENVIGINAIIYFIYSPANLPD